VEKQDFIKPRLLRPKVFHSAGRASAVEIGPCALPTCGPIPPAPGPNNVIPEILIKSPKSSPAAQQRPFARWPLAATKLITGARAPVGAGKVLSPPDRNPRWLAARGSPHLSHGKGRAVELR